MRLVLERFVWSDPGSYADNDQAIIKDKRDRPQSVLNTDVHMHWTHACAQQLFVCCCWLGVFECIYDRVQSLRASTMANDNVFCKYGKLECLALKS